MHDEVNARLDFLEIKIREDLTPREDSKHTYSPPPTPLPRHITLCPNKRKLVFTFI